MLVELTNTTARVAESTSAETKWLSTFLAFKEKSFMRPTSGGEHVLVEGKVVSLLNVELMTFPAGLAGRVVDAGPKHDVQVEVDDLRRAPGPDLLTSAIHTAGELVEDAGRAVELKLVNQAPYKHQAKAALAVLKRTRGLVEIPTGGGKGNLIALLARLYPVRWCCIVPSQPLLEQTAKRYESLTGGKAGRIGDGQWSPEPNLTVATWQTLDARLSSGDVEARRWVQSVDALVVDEAHTLTGRAAYWVTQCMTRAFIRVGLSGTPFKGTFDDIYPISATGDLIYKVTPRQLHELGLIAYPRIHAVSVLQGARVKSWATAQSKLLIDSDARNLTIAMRTKIAIEQGHAPALVLVDKTKHGERLQAAFAKVGMAVPLVHGKVKKKLQGMVLEGLRDGSIPVAIATSVWRTGLDIPELRCTFHAGGQKATIPLLQGLGRGFRVVRDENGKLIKDSFLALDIADEGCRWLASHWKQRQREYENAGYEVMIEG